MSSDCECIEVDCDGGDCACSTAELPKLNDVITHIDSKLVRSPFSKVMDLSGHKSEIIYCNMCNDEKTAITISNDNTIKIKRGLTSRWVASMQPRSIYHFINFCQGNKRRQRTKNSPAA
jgi:hypothetical protein